MENDWDLFAVVRDFSATIRAARTTNPAASPVTTNNPLPSFPSELPPPFYGEHNPFGFPALGDGTNSNPCEGLREIFYDFCYGSHSPNSTTAAASIMPRRQDLPAATMPTRTRKRRNNQPTLVRQMRKEEVDNDLWAWRKYGQKPIKGYSNPRSYYKCSTSKGWAARKHVERSSAFPDLYMVTYSGVHDHPRPTYQSSLAGTTRTRFASPAAARNGSRCTKASPAASAPPPAAGSSFAPDTPSPDFEVTALINDISMAEVYGGAAEDETNIVMLSNDVLMDDDDDVFRGLQDSDDFSGGGDFFSSGFLASPPWTPSSFGGDAAPFSGSGGC